MTHSAVVPNAFPNALANIISHHGVLRPRPEVPIPANLSLEKFSPQPHPNTVQLMVPSNGLVIPYKSIWFLLQPNCVIKIEAGTERGWLTMGSPEPPGFKVALQTCYEPPELTAGSVLGGLCTSESA